MIAICPGQALATAALAILLAGPSISSAVALDDVKLTGGIYAFVGGKQQRSPDNLANNATFGLIVTNAGAVLIDPGGSWKGAEALHASVRAVTDLPVRFVINTGGQDHRWLGNGYWKAQGARIIASAAAVADQKARASMQMSVLRELLQDKLDGTEPSHADIVFDKDHTIDIGGLTIEVRHIGPAHTPGDSIVWLPARKTVFTGDIVFTERLLGVLDISNSKSWVAAFEAVAALNPDVVVPGHGRPTTLARAKADTYDYLVNLRARIKEHQDKGGNAIGAVEIDQSAFRRLEQFEVLAGRNAQQVFSEMEFE